MDRFLGGNPLMVFLRLAVISIVVGIVMTAMGISPANLVYRLRQFVQAIYDLGFGSIEWLLQYLMLGAMVVVPIWLIMRVFGAARGSARRDDQR